MEVAAVGVHDAELVDVGLDVKVADQELAAVRGLHGLEQLEAVVGAPDHPEARAVGVDGHDRRFGGDVEGDSAAVRGPIRVLQAERRWHDLAEVGAVGVQT
jgi:hypothetical protein